MKTTKREHCCSPSAFGKVRFLGHTFPNGLAAFSHQTLSLVLCIDHGNRFFKNPNNSKKIQEYKEYNRLERLHTTQNGWGIQAQKANFSPSPPSPTIKELEAPQRSWLGRLKIAYQICNVLIWHSNKDKVHFKDL